MEIILTNLQVKPVPEFTTLLAQRIDARTQLWVEVGSQLSRYQMVPTRTVCRP